MSFEILAIALAGYLIGSIPFGILITKALGLGDLRQIGSGNIGATNVLRTGNKVAALATLLLDGAKGAVVVLIARENQGEFAGFIAGLCAFLGHLFPVWLRFRGGKGVATYLGILLALCWPAGLAACATWLGTAVASRISSLSALVAAALAPVYLWLFSSSNAVWLAVIMAALVWIKHSPNIKRLLDGTEPKIGRNTPPS